MGTYVSSIHSGVVVFPVLAFVMTLPYLIYQYRKYHSIPFWKSFVFYAFLFYLLCAYFMTILPMPECRHACDCGAVAIPPQLRPFRLMEDIAKAAGEVGLSLFHPSTWLAFIAQPDTYMTLFNVLLTLPLGMFVRYIFKAKWWHVLLAGFGMSLFYEISQLTGLFGIYDYAYRMFDVDDLIVNTLGCIGLPDSFATMAVLMAFEGIFFMVIPALTKGKTPGQAAVGLRVVRRDGTDATFGRYVVRYGLFVWLFLMGPLWLIELMPANVDDMGAQTVVAVILVIYLIWLVTIAVRAIRNAQGHPFLMLNGAVSDTTVMTEWEAKAHQAMSQGMHP